MTPSYRRFVATMLIVISVMFVFAGFAWIARWRGNDLNDASELARALNTEGGVASTLAVPYFSFKKALFDYRQPDVVVVGSSRGLVFRQSAFRKRFSNLGGGTSTAEYGFTLLDRVFTHHTPKVLVYAMDHFAFLPSTTPVDERPLGDLKAAPRVRINAVLLPYRLLIDGYMTWQQFAKLIGLSPMEPEPLPVYGMTANTEFAGGDGEDGSAYLVGTMKNVSLQSAEARFANDLGCIRRGETCRDVMRPAAHLDRRRVAQFKRLFAELRGRGIQVVPFLAPMPPLIIHEIMANGAYSYLDELRAVLRSELPEVRDMMDIEALGTSDCEFYDALHAGEIANLRALLAIARDEPVLAEYLDSASAKSTIARYQDSIMGVSDRTSEALAPLIDNYRNRDVCRAAVRRISR